MNFNNAPLVPQNAAHADRYPHTSPPSVDQISHVSSLEGSASNYIHTVPEQCCASASRGVHGSYHTFLHQPFTNLTHRTQPSGPSLAVRSVRTTSSMTGHPYPQLRARHAAADGVSHHHPNHFFTQPFVPAPASGPISQSGATLPATSQIHPQPCIDPAYNVTFPGWSCVPKTQMLAPTPSSQVELADLEYALQRYHNKPCLYQCRYDLFGRPCGQCIIGDRRRILRHLRDYHDLPNGSTACLWENCTHSRPMRQENLSRHVVMHLGVKWKCPHCRQLFSRDDAVHRHLERVLPGVVVPEAEVIPGRGARFLGEL